MNPSNNIGNDTAYSYSGADCTIYTFFPGKGSEFVKLETVHTISISVHEAKGQVRSLGHKGIKGLTRGIRTIAGSIILTVVKDHPLRSLIEDYNKIYGYPGSVLGWSLDNYNKGIGTLSNNYLYTNRLAVTLPPFNLIGQYVAENSAEFNTNIGQTPENAGWMLVGVEFIDEGQVTSINDIVTEVTYSFIASDYKPLTYHNINDNLHTVLLNPGYVGMDAEQEVLDLLYEEQNVATIANYIAREMQKAEDTILDDLDSKVSPIDTTDYATQYAREDKEEIIIRYDLSNSLRIFRPR